MTNPQPDWVIQGSADMIATVIIDLLFVALIVAIPMGIAYVLELAFNWVSKLVKRK